MSCKRTVWEEKRSIVGGVTVLFRGIWKPVSRYQKRKRKRLKLWFITDSEFKLCVLFVAIVQRYSRVIGRNCLEFCRNIWLFILDYWILWNLHSELQFPLLPNQTPSWHFNCQVRFFFPLQPMVTMWPSLFTQLFFGISGSLHPVTARTSYY